MKIETHYAKSGDVNIAYQVVGDGPRDLVVVPGWISNIDLFWEEPRVAHFFTRLASFSRLILFDKRGTGLSDRVAAIPNLETRMDDVRAVMDAVSSAQAALFGISEGGPMCTLFGATFPERTTALIMSSSYARRMWAPDYPWGTARDTWEDFLDSVVRDWGGTTGLDERAPSLAGEVSFRDWWARFVRQSASPSAGRAVWSMIADIDVRHVLPAIRVPTLIIHNAGDRNVPVEHGRYMAERIPGAKYVELPGIDHIPFVGNIGARIAALAKGGEVLVSNTVKDLVAGSGLTFEDRGYHTLKGLPGESRLFAVK